MGVHDSWRGGELSHGGRLTRSDGGSDRHREFGSLPATADVSHGRTDKVGLRYTVGGVDSVLQGCQAVERNLSIKVVRRLASAPDFMAPVATRRQTILGDGRNKNVYESSVRYQD